MSAHHAVETAILRRLSDLKQTVVAERAGLSEATVSKWKANDLEPTARILAAMGMKLVASDFELPDPDYLEALEHLAQVALEGKAAERVARKRAATQLGGGAE